MRLCAVDRAFRIGSGTEGETWLTTYRAHQSIPIKLGRTAAEERVPTHARAAPSGIKISDGRSLPALSGRGVLSGLQAGVHGIPQRVHILVRV